MRLTTVLCCAIILFWSAYTADGGKILIISPMPSPSHQVLLKCLSKILLKRRHHVTVVSPFAEKPAENLTSLVLENMTEKRDEVINEVMSGGIITKVLAFPKMMYIFADLFVRQNTIKKLIDSGETFDIVIPFWVIGEYQLGVADHFQAPIVPFSPIGNTFMVNVHNNNPSNPSYVPHLMLPFSDNMSFFERVANTVAQNSIEFFMHYIGVPALDKLNKEVFPNSRPLTEILEDIDLYLVNANIATESPRPYLPNFIPIGGFAMVDIPELPKDLQEYLDDAKEGVIYLSFGSNIQSQLLPEEQKDAIINTFGKQKMKILYKYDGEIPNKPESVRIGKVFITHGGLGGTAEATYFGVPLIGIPFLSDQFSNVATAVENGYAVMVDSQPITEETLSNALEEIITNPKYMEKVKRQAMLYKTEPTSQTEKAIYWIEHVMANKGAKHLKSPASKMPLYQLYLLDVVALIGGIALVFILIGVFIIRKCIRLVKYGKKEDLDKKHL